MLRVGLYGLALLLSVVMVAPVGAGTIDFGTFPGGPSLDPTWQSMTPFMSGGNIVVGSTYWQVGPSGDGGGLQHTIGNYMIAGDSPDQFSGTGLTFSPTDVQWWGNTDGTADPSIGFTGLNGSLSAMHARMTLEVAGNKTTNEFGYYGADSVLHTLFTGGQTAGATADFVSGSAVFGFYLKDGHAGPNFGNIYRTNGTNTGVTAGTGDQHFAVFRDTFAVGAKHAVWIGSEDVPFGGDRDYQDMIVRIDAVPEPATLLLVGSGLLGLGFAGARARRRS